MAPLTWRNVDSPSFASANQLYSLSAELMNRGFSAASRGLDKFREITTDEQSARLMQDVMAAGNDPAAIQAAATRGNSAFLSPEALRFANAQPGVLLDRQQTGLRSDIMQYGLDRSRITDGRQDTAYNAQQEANPLIYQAQQLARQGDLSGAQAIVSANADLFSRAGINASNLYGDLSGGYTGQMTDTERGVQHGDFMRIAGNAGNARELIDLAGRAFGTEAEARRGIQDLQAQGLINADLAQTALGSLGASGLWTAPTAADEIMQRYGAAPMNGRGSTNSSWAEGIGLVRSESGGNWNALNSEGYGGRLQFGTDRLADAAAAGLVPAGTTGADFSRMSKEQQTAVENWHFGDIDRQASRLGLDQYYGQNIGGVVINRDTIRSMAHLGGIGGVQRFIKSGGSYDPADSNGTRLSDYGTRFNATPLSFGSNVPRVGTQPGASRADQMLAAAINDPNRTPLTFGPSADTQTDTALADQMLEATINNPNRTPLTFGNGMGASAVDQILAATINDPNRKPLTFGDPLVASPQVENDGGARANQMLAQVLAATVQDTNRTPLTFGSNVGTQPDVSLADQMLEATINNPNPTPLTFGDHPGISAAEHIINVGTSGDNPLFTEVDGGVVTRPPMSQQETQLIARAARAGILQITPERAAQQAESDRYNQMMLEAGGRTPDVSVRPERTDGTGFQNDLNAMMRNGDISGGINRIVGGIATGRYGPAGSPFARGVGGLLDYFSASPEEAAQNSTDRQAAASAIEWWRSPEARTYFEQNPEQLEMASQNPVLFAQKMAEQAPGQMPSQQQDQRQQTPARNQNEGQQPAATPTVPAPISATDLSSIIRTAQSTSQVDRALNPFAPMDELLAGDNALSGDAASVAQQLTADGGKLSYMDTRTVRENIRELMRIPGVNSASVAGALLAQNGVVYTGTDWNPLNWGSEDQIDTSRAAEIWQQYQRPDEEGRTGIEAGVARLNNRGRTETAVTGIAQVQADYEALVTAMNQQIAQAPTQAEKDAIRKHFERNVFPLLYTQVQAIGASGALDRNANASTGQ